MNLVGEGGGGADAKCFLSELTLSWKGAVCYTCHGQKIITC